MRRDRSALVRDVSPLESGPPGPQLAADEALLDAVKPGGPGLVRWYVVDRPALVLGFAQRLRAAAVIDAERADRAGVAVLERRAGGGLVLLDAGMLCLSLALPLPHPLVPADVTESYRWLGERLAAGLRALGVAGARRVDVAAARADGAAVAAWDGPLAPLLRATCYGTLSPHEVAVSGTKLVGLAQVRRRHGALYQAGVLLRNQAALADFVRVANEADRSALRAALARRTVGLVDVLAPSPEPGNLVRALAPTLLGV